MKYLQKVAILVVMLVTTMFTTSVWAEAAHAETLTVTEIHCIDAQESKGDEVYLYNPQDEYLWPSSSGGYEDIDSGQSLYPNWTRAINVPYLVQLWEDDAIDEQLGEFTADPGTPGDFTQLMTDNDGRYEVSYTVE